MRLSSLLPTLAALSTLVLSAEYVIIKNHFSYPIWLTQVDGNGNRGETREIAGNQDWVIEQSDAPGIAIKITPEEHDIDTPGKGVLNLGYNRHPDGWLYYDIGAHNYYPFGGARTKLSGPGGDNDWSDGQTHEQHTIGYYGRGDLYLDLGY